MSYWRKCGTCKKEIGFNSLTRDAVFQVAESLHTAQLIVGHFMTQ